MPIGPGTRLGPYEVLSAIGSGGMGEVYRARDARLQRDVAIKVLPASLTSDPDRLARFEREAQVLAALNHPNIAAIHHVEETAGGPAIVMELVAGETLADRIAQGPIPVHDALAIARQIAEGLEAAHEQGIVHRDLKPANIKLTANGVVKLLDFGLAKLAEPIANAQPAIANASLSPTITSPALMTGAGMLMGTAAYMSPEQAKGKPADARSDIWAFGCVLFEMLTGRRPFDGDDVSDMLGSILKMDPDWNWLPAAIPWPLTSLLRRCLQKDSKCRMQAIADARFAIEDLQNMPAAPASPVDINARTTGRWVRLALTAATVVIIAGAIFFARTLRQTPPPGNETRFTIAPNESPRELAISPDGRTVAFTTTSGLWIRRLDSLDSVKLPGTEGADNPFWSADGRSIAFRVPAQGLYRIDAGNGTPQVVYKGALNFSTGTWNADGVILITKDFAVSRVSAAGGDVAPVTTVDRSHKETAHRHPFFLPDGHHFLYSVQTEDLVGSSIRVGSLDSGETRELVKAISHAAYVQPGWLLYQRSGTLVAQRFDVDRLELTGEPIRITDGIGFSPVDGSAAFAVSAGALIFGGATAISQAELVWFDRKGTRSASVGGSRAAYRNLELSPDQTRLAYDIVDPAGGSDIWVVDLARSVTTRLTFPPGANQRPVWSSDGSRIIFQIQGGSLPGIYVRQSNGTGNQEALLVSKVGAVVPYSVTPDGHTLLFAQAPAAGAVANLWVLPLEGERKAALLIRNPYWNTPGLAVPPQSGENHGQFSPDGKWVVYTSNESGKYEIYVESSPVGAGKWQISSAGGMQPRWQRDGREIFYIAPDGILMAVPINTAGGTLQPQVPVALFKTQLGATVMVPGTSRKYDVSADGQRFLVNTPIQTAASTTVTVILDWQQDLKR